MKNGLLILFTLCMPNLAFAQKDYLTFEARIDNRNSDTIYITSHNKIGKIIRRIAVNKEGYFKDTLKVSDGLYTFYDKAEVTSLYLKNGYNLSLTLDAQKFDETVAYTGIGARENNFLAKMVLMEQTHMAQAIRAGNETDFASNWDEVKKQILLSLKSGGFDSSFVKSEEKELEKQFLSIQVQLKQQQLIRKLTGKISPSFEYENYNGGNTKLEDLRGKYVYIDVWATWCGPCVAEMPFLRKVEEEYKDMNITFVGISIDIKASHDKWRNFVKAKAPAGIQLMADNDWTSRFMKEYFVNSIPRFILIDPEGKIVNADAARPSSPQLKEDLAKLLN